MTEEPKRLKPRILFVKTLLPIFKADTSIHESYFLCLSKLIKEIEPKDLQEFFEAKSFVDEIIKRINERPFIEALDNDVEDYTLNGLLLLLQTLLEKYRSLKSECTNLASELLEYLFYLPPNSDHLAPTNFPKCKRKTTRKRCFNLLIELCKDHPDNSNSLIEILTEYCKNLHSREHYDSVVLKT